jgi:hypothetical protein
MINKVISFIVENGTKGQKDTTNIEEYIAKHRAYKTCNILYDKDKEITALSRWNVVHETAHILDVIIRKDCRNKGILKQLVKLGHKTFPDVKYIMFERGWRKDNEMRRYEIKRFM